METDISSTRIYYTETNPNKIIDFKTSDKYNIFKQEYIESIDITIDFYLKYATDDYSKKSVKEGLNAFKNRLFGQNTTDNDKHLTILFHGKKAMEEIAQALIPPKGEKRFSPEAITEKLIAIYNLAGKDIDPLTGAEEIACMVCAPGTLRNLIDTAQLLNTGNLFDNVQIQRKNIILEVIKKYVLITNRAEIEQQAGWQAHDTNLLNVFINALNEEWGLPRVIEPYVKESTVTEKNKVEINERLYLAVTQDNITNRLANDYLRKIKENIIINDEGTIDLLSANNALGKFEKLYGKHEFTSVFSVDDNYQVLGITTDPTAIKVAISQFISQENNSREHAVNMYPLTWEEKVNIELPYVTQNKKLYYSDDLFWIELTDKDGDISIALPSIQDLGKESINKVGYSQLHQIIQQSSSQEDTKILFQMNLERLDTADKELLELFFSKLATNNSPDMVLQYAYDNQAWFEYLAYKTKSNPLATILLAHKPNSELITDWPEIALHGMSAQQAEQSLSALDSDGISADKAIEYVDKNFEWFHSVIERSRSNPLLPILLARLSPSDLMNLPSAHPCLYECPKSQLTEFLSRLDTGTEVANAIQYVTQHSQWFSAKVDTYHENPLLPILLDRLSPQKLETYSPEDTILRGLSASQLEKLLSALAPEGSDVTKATAYFIKHLAWFSSKMKAIGRNLLLPTLLARFTQSELMALSPENPLLQELSVEQIRQFLSALDSRNSVTNIIKYVTEHVKWFNSLVINIGHNPLLPILLTRLTPNEFTNLSQIDSALFSLTEDQIKHLFSALDPENSGLDNSIEFVTKYSKWFNQLTEMIEYNPLFPLILERMGNNLLTLVPDIALSGLSVQQAKVFFSKLIPDKTSVTEALKYVTLHKKWFKALVDNMDENPLIPLLLTHLNQEEIATLIPTIALYNPSTEQTKEFLASLDSPESKEITKALAYANKHKRWFNIQVIKAKENLLIERMISLYSPQRLAKETPDSIAFEGLNSLQAESFLSKLDESEEGSITQALAYVSQYPEWFDSLIKREGLNPLLWIVLIRQDGEQLSQLQPDSLALRGIKANQATSFLSVLMNKNDGDITKVEAYVSQHQEWFDSLIKREEENPLINIVIHKLSQSELAKLDPITDNFVKGISAQQAVVFLGKLDPNSTNITAAIKYATLYNEWFSAFVKKTKQNPLTTLLLSRMSAEELATSDVSNIALEGMSAEQSRNFFNFLVHNSGTNITPALDYATRKPAWFNILLENIGENPLTFLIIKHYSPTQLEVLAPDNIALKGLSAHQFRWFFVKLIGREGNLSRGIAYLSKHQQWFTKLVTKIGENPLIPPLLNLPRDTLAELKPDITLFGLSAKQSKEFFARLVDNSNFTQALIYAETHEDWFRELVNRTGENPITSAFIKKILGFLHQLPPDDIALWGMSAHQAGVFLASMDSDNNLNRALEYINKHQEWFSNLVENTKKNPLTPLLIARLSSEELAKQPPEIALLGLTEHQSQDFLSRMSPENVATYVKDHHQWFNQQGWDIAALSVPRKNAPISSDAAPFDIRMVNSWKIPEVEPLANEENTRFDGQVIIQLENEPIVREAVARLAGKHPNNSVIVQLDQDNNYRVVHGDLKKLEGIVRWQLVGHSRVEGEYQTLGARSPEALAEQLGKFMTLSGGASPSPSHISLVGGALGQDNTAGSYLHQFASSLTKQPIHAESIAAYATKLAVNTQGQKRLTETGEKMVLTQNGEQWITTRMQGKFDAEGAGRELLAILNLAQNFEHAMDAVYRHNGLSESEWLPELSSLKKDPIQPHDLLTFVRNSPSKTGEPPEQRTVPINDAHIPDFIREYDQYLARSKNAFTFADGQLIPHSEDYIAEIEGIHGLNMAFILQAWFMQRARKTTTAGAALPANLNTALQVHFYVNYAQIRLGLLDDGVKFIKVAREFIQESSPAGAMFKVFSHLGTGTVMGLNVLNIGLDSYELAHAQNEAQRAIFDTQLAFDLANLTLSVASFGASIAGAATLASFLGPLGVPLVGLGIGITALVITTQEHVEKTKAVGAYFANLDEGYIQGGYRCVNVKAADGTEHQIWRNHAGIAIKTLDLRLGHQMLTYADTYIYKTHINGIGSGYDNDITMALPQSEKRRLGKSAVVNIREGINHQFAVSFAPDEKIPLVLPDTPQYYLDYNYDSFPGVTSRHDAGFDVLRRIESNYRSHSDNFSFDFYCCPSEYAISELKAEYVATPVQVLLDDVTRTIIMPTQSKETKDKMAYTLTGGNGTYHISLQEGATLALEGGSTKTTWILDARSLSNTDNLTFNSSGQLCVGDIKITLAADFQGTLQLTNQEGLFVADVQKQQISLLNADASHFKDTRLLHAYLKQVTHPDLHNQPFVPVEDYLTPEGERVGRAFYETAKDRFIFTREPNSAEFLRGAQLLKTDGNTAWFFRDSNVWLVDIASGEILREYIPIDFEDMTPPSKSSVINDDTGNVYLISEYQKTAGSIRYTWQLTGKTMTLIAISGDQLAIPNINDFFWPLPAKFSNAPRVMGTLGDEIHLLARHKSHNYHSWLRKSAGETVHRPFLQANMATIAAEDIQPIPMQIGDETHYYFYSRQQQTLYFQPDNGLSKAAVKAHAVKAEIHTLFEFQGQLVVQSNDGTFWLADAQGKLHLTGVTSDWLRAHQNDVMAHLRKLVATTDTLSALRLQGLLNDRGRLVMAWYDIAADRVILSGSGIPVTHALHYRGLSTDGKQAWVYDNDNKRLYRQPLEPQTPFTLNEKGQSTTKALPATRWSSWLYRSVISEDDHLRLVTDDGAVLLLPKMASTQTYPKLIAWQTEKQTQAQSAAAIERLRGQVILAPAIRQLTQQTGQAPTWYLTEQKTFLRAHGLNSEHDLHWLGQSAGAPSAHYIHDRTTNDLWLANASHSTAIGRYRFIVQRQDELVLEYDPSNHVKTLILPQLMGMDSIILTGEMAGAHYQLNAATLKYYQQIVIDEQGQQPVIHLPETVTRLVVKSSGQDIILSDQASKTQICIANAEQAAKREMKIEIEGISPFSINHLAKKIYQLGAQLPDDKQSKDSLTGIILQISPIDHTIEYYPLSTKTEHSSKLETSAVHLTGTMSTFDTIRYDHNGLLIDNSAQLSKLPKSTYYYSKHL